jgi:hypothetical protein
MDEARRRVRMYRNMMVVSWIATLLGPALGVTLMARAQERLLASDAWQNPDDFVVRMRWNLMYVDIGLVVSFIGVAVLITFLILYSRATRRLSQSESVSKSAV